LVESLFPRSSANCCSSPKDEAAKEANIRDPVKNPKSEQTVNWLAYYVAIYGKAYLVVLFGVLMVTLLLLWII